MMTPEIEQLLNDLRNALTTGAPPPQYDTDQLREALTAEAASAYALGERLSALLPAATPAPVPTPPEPAPPAQGGTGREVWLYMPNMRADMNAVWTPAGLPRPDRLVTFTKVGYSSDWDYNTNTWADPTARPYPADIIRLNKFNQPGEIKYAMRWEPQDLLEDLAAGKHNAWTTRYLEQLADADLPEPIDACPAHEMNATWGAPINTQAERNAVRATPRNQRSFPYAVRRAQPGSFQPHPQDVQWFADWVGHLRDEITRTGANMTLTFNPNVAWDPDGNPTQIDYRPIYAATDYLWDAVGLDGYNGPWLDPEHQTGLEVFDVDLTNMRAMTDKPIGIYETGTKPGVNGWWTGFVNDLNAYHPYVNVLTQFEVTKEAVWNVALDPARAADFINAVSIWR